MSGKLTMQEVFDIAYKKVIAQRAPALRGHECALRAPGGHRCAIGAVLQGHLPEHSPLWDYKGGVGGLLRGAPDVEWPWDSTLGQEIPGEASFLVSLQAAHDLAAFTEEYGQPAREGEEFISEFRSRMEYVAADWSLSTAVMDETQNP